MNKFADFMLCASTWFFIGVIVVYLGASFTYMSWQEVNVFEWQSETRLVAFSWLLICIAGSIGAVVADE